MTDASAPRPLDPAEKRALFEDGYVHLPGVVPRGLVDDALRAINGSLGAEGMPKEALPTFRARTYTPELVDSPAIRNLYALTALPALVESAIGDGKVRPPPQGQIALRFPAPGTPAVPHIDGVYTPENGVPAGTLWHFTALVGVFLSDVLEPDRGNFTVWPGSHHLLEAHVRRHGPASISSSFPELPLPPARPIVARAGDAVLAHYQLAHGIAPNLGPHVRYAVFFRLFHVEHDARGTAALADVWREWEGMKEVVRARPQPAPAAR
jgi:hypothetical protein